jgi:S-DNA-T family DNA segregation ATPase FtsK/SpoIIIE
MITTLSFLIIIDKSVDELIASFFYNLEDKTLDSKKIDTKKPDNKEPDTFKPLQLDEQPPKEIQHIDVDEFDKPSYLRNKTIKKIQPLEIDDEDEVEHSEVAHPKEVIKNIEKPHNILDIASKVKEQKNAVIVEELEENKKLLETIEKGTTEKPKNFTLPSIKFLQEVKNTSHSVDESELDDKIRYLIEKLAHFKIDGDVVRTYAGPVVSTFEFKPAANVKVSKILNLQDDLAMALSAETIRIQAPIPGKDVVGIEIPNDTVDTIYLRELLDSKLFKESASPLTIALGKDIVGKPFITDLKKLPHLLIAGTTGSGKSVGINAMILSLLYKNSPDQLRLLMIDPKMLEFSIYNDIPHLLTPVITKPKQAIVALNNMVSEMERRYELMSDTRTKNIENYNEKVKKEGGEHFPYMVVIIDELADLMMTSGKDVEHSIARLAQMARASGIHLIVATQRPSVDVVTGLIKANLPSRISYRVGQKVDSKIILDQMGAESLLGRGDMLFTPPGATGLVRLHAPWSTEDEIEKIVEFIKSQREPNYDKSFLVEENESENSPSKETYEELDPLFDEAKNVVLTDRKTSISYLQRKLQIGYNRSARVIEQLEVEGVLSAPNSKGIREIL